MKLFRALVLMSLVAIVGCGNSESTAESPSESATATLTSSEPAIPEPVDVFTPKSLPNYGTDTGDALKDELDVSMWVINGKTSDGATEIALTSRAGVTPNPAAIEKGFLPKGVDPCAIPYSALIRPMYEKCFTEGMSMAAVSNIVGWQGKEISRTGESVAYQWSDTDGGNMVISFDGDRLVSASQVGLKP